MTVNQPIIETHRHIFGESTLKLIENYDPAKPLPQLDNTMDLFFYRDWTDNDYAMDVQRQAGITTTLISRGGEVEMFAYQLLKTDPADTIKQMNYENLEIQERYPEDLDIMADVHALYSESLPLIEEFVDQHGAKGLSISSSYGQGSNQVFLDDPRCDWLWEFAEDRDLPVHIHPPMVAIGHEVAMTYRLNEAATRPMDTGLSLARMIYAGIFDRYPKLKVVGVHMGGVLPSIIGRLNFNWRLNYHGIENPPIDKVDKNEKMPSDYCQENIYVDTMGFNPWALKAAIDLFGIDRVLFGSDYGPVPISPKEHVDLVHQVVSDPDDQQKILWGNAGRLFKLGLG